MMNASPPTYWRQLAVLGVVGVLLLVMPVPWQVRLVGGIWVAVAALAGLVWVVKQRTGKSSTAIIARWSSRSKRNGGVASRWDLFRVASTWAMRRKAAVLRPSLDQVSWWRRMRTPVTEYATELATVGRRGVWSPCEDVTLRVGGPRTGKTGELAGRIVDAPGAVIATSTRKDIVGLTGPSRKAIGPVRLFNPSGIGHLQSTVTWTPLAGCADLATAQRRAADMIPASAHDEGERWDAQARRILSVFLHAAAVAKLPMRAVLAWASAPEDPKSQQRVDEALSMMPNSPATRAVRFDARQFFEMNDRTQTSITTTMMPALQWLTDTSAAGIGDVDPTGDDVFDVSTFLHEKATLYLLGAETGVTAPLIAALTAEIAYTARMVAEDQPAGRLDPPLTIALDEAALICPVPLDKWTADMGGRNITLHISLQSRSQLRQRWGVDGAATVLNNVATILVYGGQRDPDDLAAWSNLSGERDEDVDTHDAEGELASTTGHRVPVLSAAQIANLPERHVLIIKRGMPAAVGQTVMAWKRRDVKKTNKEHPYEPRRTTQQTEQAAHDAAAAGAEITTVASVPMRNEEST